MRRHFKPSPKYLTKTRLTVTIVAVLVLLSAVLIAWLMSLDGDIGSNVPRILLAVTASLVLIVWLPAMILLGPYYHSLSYEIENDEVIMRVGIITKSVKHVPYRTVTNITIKRGILDRWLFGLGTLNIQTAGMSGTTGAEESLEGLANVHEVYDLVVAELRRFRAGMAPTAAGLDEAAQGQLETAPSSPITLQAILTELQAIRQAVEST